MSIAVGDLVAVKNQVGIGEVLYIRNSGEANVKMDSGFNGWVQKGDYTALESVPEAVAQTPAPTFED